ncbi:NAD(P)/FAD-dependent oxidoreductase [Mycena kentingensis (nom. inval.)]|nr:NAD(P)/FAD-dependent oxidoreductase [Mycena kentingensis (nom. inval.)]
MSSTTTTPKLVIIGAGFAGMWAAVGAARKRHLAGKPDNAVDIVVIAPDAEPTLYVRPRLYETDFAEAHTPLGPLFAAVGVKYVQGTVIKLLPEAKAFEYVSGNGEKHTLAYDAVILATGSKLFRPADVAGLDEFTVNADDMPNAHKLDAHLKALAALPASPARNTVVVVGGSFTGVEIAAEMPRRLREILGAEMTPPPRVVVLERGKRIDFMGENSKATPLVEEVLAGLGVELVTGEQAATVDAEGITTASGLHIACKTVIWAAGMRAEGLTAQLPPTVPRDNLGRLLVTPELKVPGTGLEGFYAAGDTAGVAADDKGHWVLQSCQHANNLGKTAGYNAMAELLGLGADAIRYCQPVYGTCLSLGPWGALFTMGWEREINKVEEEGFKMKTYINTQASLCFGCSLKS